MFACQQKVLLPWLQPRRAVGVQQYRFVSKLRDSADQALAGLNLEGAMVAVGGFGLGGVPETLIEALSQNESAKDLTLISLTAGTDDRGVGQLIKTGKVRRMIAAYVGENKVFENLYFNGKLEVELTPMGTIAQRLQCAGAGTYGFRLLWSTLFVLVVPDAFRHCLFRQVFRPFFRPLELEPSTERVVFL